MKKITLLSMLLLSLYTSAQQDKLKHFVAGSIISASTYHITYSKTHNKNKAIVYSIASGIIAGTLKELHDTKTTGFDNKDLAYTISGSIFINISIDIFKH
jgi:uncharacterized protein YfiM (DUF2279 family)